MTQFKEGDLVQYNPERIDTTEVGRLTGLVVEISTVDVADWNHCLLYTSPSPRDLSTSRMPSSA